MAKNELRLEGTPRNESVRLNGVDLSYRNVTSVPLGMLLPVMVQEVVGKSRVRIGLESQTRCRPLVVPSFVRIREHFDYFFVPYSQLWHQYDNFKTMQANYNSTLSDTFMNSELPNRVPTFGGAAFNLAAKAAYDDNIVDVAGYSMAYGMLRIADNLGYGVIQAGTSDTFQYTNYHKVGLNPFRALAYQKIYSDYYRNDKYEGNYPNHYNVDDIKFSAPTSSNPYGNYSADRLQRIFEPHYRWKKLDYFTSVWPNDIPNEKLFGFEGFVSQFRFYTGNEDYDFSVSSAPSIQGTPVSNGVYVNNSLSTANTTDIDGDRNVRSVPGSVGAVVPVVQGITTQRGVQSQAIHRLLAAQERYLRKLYAAKQNFPSIMKALFGYSPNIGRNGSVMHLGGLCNRISVSDVNNTASFEDLGANGKINNYGSSNKIVDNFEVPEDGLIMCIYSTSVENDYRSNQLNRHNVKSYPEEYYNPNYELLGRQPIFGFEYRTAALGSTDVPSDGDSTRVLGYVERYLEYKTHVDEVHGCFATDSFSPYAAYSNNDLAWSKPLSLTSLIIKPALFDRIIAGGLYDGKTESDHFYLNIYNKVDCLTPIKVGDGI